MRGGHDDALSDYLDTLLRLDLQMYLCIKLQIILAVQYKKKGVFKQTNVLLEYISHCIYRSTDNLRVA